MNVMEVARYLFVSRPHVRVLVERGALTGTPTESGDYEIDEASVEKYAVDRKRAAKDISIRKPKTMAHSAYEVALAIRTQRPNRLTIMKWLFRFASSQKNVDCVVLWVGRFAEVLGLIAGIVLVVAIIRR